MKYLAVQRYASGLYPGGFAAGDVLDLDEEHAGSINRDAPGTLVPYAEGMEAPPADRQVKAAEKRGDRGNGGVIDKASFKAVKD